MESGIVLLTYAAPSVLLALYAFNVYWLMGVYMRKGRRAPAPVAMPPGGERPKVVTQIPVYNEVSVVERAMRAAVAMRYEGLHIVQVLDDSTDETRELIDRVAAELRRGGHRIEVVRRDNRDGFKAGALRHGMEIEPAPFYAIFDADFEPTPDFLERCMPVLLTGPNTGFVQCRWGHLNEYSSWQTRCVSIGMDGHFAIEQSARCMAGLFMNFNGTAGVWRRQAILDAGDWEDDTLTEDMDLSYRAQLAGWKPAYLNDVCVPAEVPEDMNAFKAQQFRWAKGSTQTAFKLLPRIWRSAFPLRNKVQATLHMTHYFVHPLMLWMAIVALPSIMSRPHTALPLGGWYLAVMIAAAAGPTMLYVLALHRLKGRISGDLAMLPALSSLGMGLAVNNSIAVFEAFCGHQSPFQRTPKRGTLGRLRYKPSINASTLAEIGLALVSLINIGVAARLKHYWMIPFLLQYAAGFTMVSGHSIGDWWKLRRDVLPAVLSEPLAVSAGHSIKGEEGT